MTQVDIYEAIYNGQPIACDAEEWPRVRDMLAVAIRQYMRWDNELLWSLAKQELARLQGEFGE